MLRAPNRLCQTVSQLFPIGEVYTPEVAFSRSFASSRGSSSIIFSCVTSFSSRTGVLFIGFPIVFCLSKSLVFSPSRLKRSYPRSHSSYLFVAPVQSPGSSSTVCLSDATFEPGVRTWVPRRLCQLVSSGWIPPPLPRVVESGFHTGSP